MRFRCFALVALCAVLSALLPTRTTLAAPRCFTGVDGINDCIDGSIRAFWERQGGLPVFGYPIGPQHKEQTERGQVTVQLFERARLELHPENQPPYDVLLGRLGADALARVAAPPATREEPRAGCRFFTETGLNVCGPFLATYAHYGLDLGAPGISEAESLALFGAPLTPAVSTTWSDGSTGTQQWFERARFEDHGANGVLLGLLGRELDAQGTGGASQEPTANPAPMPNDQPGGFIQVSGNQLTRLGQPVVLKGVNYYPQGKPWTEMWTSWSASQIARELQLGRDQLGINTIRILVPHDASSNGTIRRAQLGYLREIVQIAGDLDLRLIVTLFDQDQEFPTPGSPDDEEDLQYMRTLVGNFVGDDRIIAWDIHNEPDQYNDWINGDAPHVLNWLGHMADAIHAIDPNHLVTVGMAQYDNLWQPGPDGRRVVDYSDVIGWHNYNADDAARQIDELRQHTDKPIVLEEFGWPTGPACYVRDYHEDHQAEVYRTMLEAAQGRTAGVFAWVLRDFDSGPSRRWENEGEHYGLYRIDGTLKPAANVFRAFPGALLPSAVKTNLPLTEDELGPPGGETAPLLIPGTGHYVKGYFRRAWELMGGQANFGLPLSEAFERPGDKLVTQYFEKAVLEYHPEKDNLPNWGTLEPVEQTRLVIIPTNVGDAFAAGRGFGADDHLFAAPFDSWYDRHDGRWRLGSPISAVLSEDVNGAPTTVQYFQRGRLEANLATGDIMISALGQWALQQQCAATGG